MYTALIDRLKVRLTQALPSALAHDPLRAIPVGKVVPKFEHKLPPRPGSVLILLHEMDGKIMFPLTKRAEYNGAHSGQISLPGGKAEPGENAVETALREAEEEIGVSAESIQVIGRLSEFFVTPVVAVASSMLTFRPDPREVVQILQCNLIDLVKEDAVQVSEIMAAGAYRMQAPHFSVQGEIVWGATAMMLNEFRVVLQEIG